MFKTETLTKKSQETRAHILATALQLFREQGFDDVTMRDIAQKAETALGGAYYYFPSKEALVVAYYHWVQDEHTRRVREAIGTSKKRPNLRERLGIAMHSKIEIIQNDRKLLGAPFRYTGTPDHPLSFLGKGTKHIRQQAIDVFDEVIGAEDLPKDVRESLPIAFWALHMGIMLYFLYDDTPHGAKTHKLIDNALDLSMTFLTIAKYPLMRPFRGKIMGVLREAELV